MNLIPLPAFQDNYLWMLHDGRRALVVDPGDAQPVLACLQRDGLQLEAILVTHHHPEHIDGVDALRQATGAVVYGPARARVPEPLARLAIGDTVDVLGLRFEVLDVHGDPAGHVAYYCTSVNGRPLLFCGGALFPGPCGRLFKGSPAQMLSSLDKLAALPGSTRVCCAHEFTSGNPKITRAVEPRNAELIHSLQRSEELRTPDQPTLLSTIEQAKLTHPFLRTRIPRVAQAARDHDSATPPHDVAVLAALGQ